MTQRHKEKHNSSSTAKIVTQNYQQVTLYVHNIVLLILRSPWRSVLQDQQTEPVQIHCKQLHSHTSYVCKLATVCNILQSIIRICNALCGSVLQDQQTEPVQIHCKQTHSHTSCVSKVIRTLVLINNYSQPKLLSETHIHIYLSVLSVVNCNKLNLKVTVFQQWRCVILLGR